MSATTEKSPALNVSRRLTETARARPDAVAVAFPRGYDAAGRRRYDQVAFRELEEDVERIARGLVRLGVVPGMRLALLVKPSIDFIALVFSMLRSGAVTVLIDPGMGRKNLLGCLDDVAPEGFVAIPTVHAVRVLLGRRYRRARLNVTVGRRWFWGGATLDQVRGKGESSAGALPEVAADDPAAIIFTTGSTGPPKGVLYTHRNFDTQVTEIRDRYHIAPGEVDLPGFPLFGLFNCAMGVTTVIPDMDPTRPAQVDPKKILEAVRDWNVTQAFGSPAIWNRVGRYCQASGEKLPTLRRVLSAGAPVPADVLERMKNCIHPDGEIHTPYGATEALPVASISASEVLSETATQTNEGAGVCVGSRFPAAAWKVIRICDEPIASLDDAEELPTREIGELIVRGPQVTQTYATCTEWNARSKIRDGDNLWHRMGDVGYFDEASRFWFCGRKTHRVETEQGTLYPVRCEAILNTHPAVYRSALVGIGTSNKKRPVLIVELEKQGVNLPSEQIIAELRDLAAQHTLTANIHDFLLHPALPVDIRHNAKIFREQLSTWAAEQLPT